MSFTPKKKEMKSFVLFAWPAQELVLGYLPEADWPARWEALGGRFTEGRMIAAKTDPIWRALGRRSGGVMVRELSREEAVRLGVMTEEMIAEQQKAAPDHERAQRSARASADGFAPGELEAIRDALKAAIAKGERKKSFGPGK